MIENHLNSFAAGALFRNTQRVGRNSRWLLRPTGCVKIRPTDARLPWDGG